MGLVPNDRVYSGRDFRWKYANCPSFTTNPESQANDDTDVTLSVSGYSPFGEVSQIDVWVDPDATDSAKRQFVGTITGSSGSVTWPKTGQNHTAGNHTLRAYLKDSNGWIYNNTVYSAGCQKPYEIVTATPVGPAITQTDMRVDNNTQTTAVGKKGYSGLQVVEPGGGGWYNWMTVSQTVKEVGGPASDIDLAVVGFVPNAVYPEVGPNPAWSQLTAVRAQADSGFVLGYAQNDTDVFQDSEGKNLQAGHYYVYHNGQWYKMGTLAGLEFPRTKDFCIHNDGKTSAETDDFVCASNGKVRVSAVAGADYFSSTADSITVKWDVYLWQSFGSKALKTYAYGGDKNGRKAFVETRPDLYPTVTPQPVILEYVPFWNNFLAWLRSLLILPAAGVTFK